MYGGVHIYYANFRDYFFEISLTKAGVELFIWLFPRQEEYSGVGPQSSALNSF